MRRPVGAAGAIPALLLAALPAAGQPAPDAARVTITGVRISAGTAVDCPAIRDDAGAVHPVSYLSPGIAIGDRVSVTGFPAVTTTCLGKVLVVEEERPGG